jgi:hypothetical protein
MSVSLCVVGLCVAQRTEEKAHEKEELVKEEARLNASLQVRPSLHEAPPAPRLSVC